MESNPALSLLGFWMMMQLFATLALLAGGIYLMFCLGRAASGLDRMASAMEDWVARQNQAPPTSHPQKQSLPPLEAGSTPGHSAGMANASSSANAPQATPFTPAAPSPPREYSQHEAMNPDEK